MRKSSRHKLPQLMHQRDQQASWNGSISGVAQKNVTLFPRLVVQARDSKPFVMKIRHQIHWDFFPISRDFDGQPNLLSESSFSMTDFFHVYDLGLFFLSRPINRPRFGFIRVAFLFWWDSHVKVDLNFIGSWPRGPYWLVGLCPMGRVMPGPSLFYLCFGTRGSWKPGNRNR